MSGTLVRIDGRLILAAPEKHDIKLWDAVSEECLTVLLGHSLGHSAPLRGIVGHPNRQAIVSCSDDRTVRLWDVPAAIRTGPETQRQFWTSAVALAPDGTAVTSSWDGDILR
jgi:WD40 repeat protein